MSGETNYQNFSGDSLQREMLQSSEEQLFEQLKTEFANEYDISSKAGQSGQGDVFFARHKQTLQWYVLKAAKTEGKVFEQEARFALSLGKHPNLVYTHTIIEKHKKQFLLMEYIGPRPYSIKQKVRGDTLTNELKHFTRGLKKEQALLWAIDLCHGMEYLYSKKDFQGHNDIKPDNLFITQEGVLKVGDFGMVNQVRGGTRGYRSKEFREGKQGQARDIYAFGIVFYQMLNGLKNPTHPTIYGAKTLLNDTREDLLLDWAAINKSKYSAILRKCLKEDDKDRYTGFSALRADLEKEFNRLDGVDEHKHREIPLDAREYCKKGEGWLTLRENKIALENYENAIQIDPKYAPAYYGRCKANHGLACYKNVLVDCDKMLELGLKEATIYYFYGKANAYFDCYEKALEYFNNAIKLKPQFWSAYYERGYANLHLQRYAAAMKDFEKGTNNRFDRQSLWVFYKELGDTKYGLKNYQEAIKDYDKSFKLNPSYILTFINRSRAKMQLNLYEEVIIDCTKAIGSTSDKYHQSEFYYIRGISKFALLKHKEAILDYNQAIKLNPKYINAYLNRGKVYMHLKKYTQAEKDFKQALSLNKNDKKPLEQLLKLYQTQNKPRKAAQIKKQLDDLNKNKGE